MCQTQCMQVGERVALEKAHKKAEDPLYAVERYLAVDAHHYGIIPVYNKLEQHFTSVVAQYEGGISDDNLQALFSEQCVKNVQDSIYAGYLLNPIYFVQNAAGKWVPFAKLSQEQVDKFLRVVEGITAPGAAAVAASKAALSLELNKAQLKPLLSRLASFMPHLTTRTAQSDVSVQVADVKERVTWWRSYCAETFPLFTKAAVKLLGMSPHVPLKGTGASGAWYAKSRNRFVVAKGEEVVHIRGNREVGNSSNDFDACEQVHVAGEEIEEIL
jgi:hypothetical protein